jgi:hypothetical protein
MKKSIAILLTVIVVIVGVWLADSYWVFTGESLNYATWQLLVGFFVFMLFAVSSLVSFYRTAIKKHIARTIINLFLALLVFSFAFSASINMVNSAIFNMLHGGNNNMMGTSFMKSTTICGHALNKGDGLFRVSNAYTEENGQYFVVAFCPSIVYKTDQVMTDKSLMDALK